MKYWSNQNNYAIYDGFVDKVLMAYERRDKFSSFKQSDLKTFTKFKNITDDFINHYYLTDYTLKEIVLNAKTWTLFSN